MLKENNCQLRILYLAKLDEVKMFSGKNIYILEFVTNRLTLKEILKGDFYAEGKYSS